MLNLLRCYLSGRHDYGVGCEPGAVFLRCVHCGRRSSGWALESRHTPDTRLPRDTTPRPVPVAAAAPGFGRPARPPLRVVAGPRPAARVIPFQRSAAH